MSRLAGSAAGALADPGAQGRATAKRAPARWRRLWTLLRDSLRPTPAQPVHPDWFSAAEVASYDRAVQAGSGEARIDDATWSDLQVDAWLRPWAADTSLPGRQMLVHRLRQGRVEPSRSLAATVARTADAAPVLAASAPARLQLRCVRTDLVPALFGDALPELPAWADRLWLVPLLLAAGVLLALAQAPVAAAFLLLAWAGVSAVFVARLSAPLRQWRALREDLVATLVAGHALARAARLSGSPCLAALAGIEAVLQAQCRRVAPNAAERLPAVLEYLNLVSLYDYVRMRRQLAALRADLAGLRVSYEHIADADAELALVAHLLGTRHWCAAQVGGARQLVLSSMVHPLLPGAVPLSLQLQDRGLLLTGHNGVGKSTLLRAVGLNLLAARAFGFCYAAQAMVPDLPVLSSIENHDSLQTADSLYMAELRRAAALLRAASTGGGAVILVDELFRGTNATESVSAAAAVLAALARRSLVLVSTHSGVLAPLLRLQLVPMRLVRAEAPETPETLEAQCMPTAGLALEPGVLAEPNGIDTMKQHDFPAEVLASARAVATWLATRDAQAQDPPELRG